MFVKMESTQLEAGNKNHLQNVLSQTEIENIPQEVAAKINNYIVHKIEECSTAQAHNGTTKCDFNEKLKALEVNVLEITSKYNDTAKKLLTAEKTATELENQVIFISSDLELAQDKIKRLEKDVISFKIARDTAINEKNDLTHILHRRDTEIDRLTASEAVLSQQLRAAIDAKCDTLASNGDVLSKELVLQYREKHMEGERNLLNSQIANLNEEVFRLTSKLQTDRLDNTSRLIDLETQLAEKLEELTIAKNTISQLNEAKKALNNRIESLTQRLIEQREIESKMKENYNKELDAKNKVNDMMRGLYDEAESKAAELTDGVRELQKLLNESVEKYGVLETKYKQADVDHEELIKKKNEIISRLNMDLEHANDSLRTALANNLNKVISEFTPTAATANKLFKSGMSLTQVYSQLANVTDELSQEKEENKKLNSTINAIVQEIEEKAPTLRQQKMDYEEALERNIALSQELELLTSECNKLKNDYTESSKIADCYNRENTVLKGELADLGKQVCFLLKELELSRSGLLPNGDHDSSITDSNTANSLDVSSSRMTSKNLVTFSDIQELQSNNQKLLRIVRDLTEKQEEFECLKEQFEIGEMETKIEYLKNRVSELTEAQDRHLKMINDLIRDRDMFKQLYHDLMKGKCELSADEAAEREKSGSFAIESSPNKSTKLGASSDKSSFEIKYIETEKHLELIKEQFKTYKEEKVTKERMLFDKIDNLRQEILQLTDINSKITSNAEYNNDRIHILQTNITTYTNRITSLEEKNNAYNATIAKQEVALQHIRDEAVKAQNKLAEAEIQVENLKMENKLLRDAELRLQSEKEMLDRGRQGQSLLLTNLELIKASLERVEAENRVKLETRLDEATLELSVLRRRLQEEQDRFRELASNLEKQTETAKSTMQEEKLAADLLRKEINDMRNELADKRKENEEILTKLKVALAPNTDDSFDTVKRIRDLENKLSDKQKELNSVNELLTVAKEHIKQYCEIYECAQKELEGLHAVHNEYKLQAEAKMAEYANKLQKLENKSSELEAELLLHTNGEHSNSNAKLKIELSNIKEELRAALANIDTYRNDLESAREENKKLSEVAQKAEEKYSNEMILHSADIQALTRVKEDLSKAQNQLNELVALKDSTLETLENEKASWAQRQTILMSENEQLSQRLMDLNVQNTLLHDQITALGTQLSISHTSLSQTEVLESSVVANMNVSVSENDINSSEQLFQIVKFLRKEKDMAMVKFDILQAETLRLRSLLENAEKQLDEAKLALAAEMERSEVSIVSVNKQSEILRKIETMNALSDSNRILREERDTLTQRIEEMSDMVKKLEEELTPLQEKICDLTSKNVTLHSENMALKADCSSWRTRVTDLIERANKIKPEDWKRLQDERETLAKMLSSEKENVKKLNEELGSVKVEKAKLKEQYIELSRQQNNLLDENKKLSEEVQMLKDDLSRSLEELTKTKAEFTVITELNSKLTEDLTNKDASLSDIRTREMQIRKIAKKYKTQYLDLVKAVQEEQKKAESEESAINALTESTRSLQEQINELHAKLETEKKNTENLKHELETLSTTNLDREERSKQVLKQAKIKIVQLTEKNHSLSRELDETRTKMGAMEQSTRDEHDVRLAAISSQYEGRVARLEKEFGEVQAEKARELDVLAQKVTVLQRQLASQASAAKQQATTEKTTAGPPTANIKPMAGVAQQNVGSASELPLASIRPMTQAGSTAPQAPRDSSPSLSCASLAPSAPVTSATPTESTQDMDTSEAGMGSPVASDCNAQSSSHSQALQQIVAMVLPRIVTPSVDASATAASASASPVAAISATPASTQPGSACEASTQAAGSARASKRRLPAPALASKRTKAQGSDRSLEVEYQTLTSSPCDQDDDGVIVVDSEEDDDESRTGAVYREGDDEESEEEQEVETSDEAEEEEEEEEESESDGEDNAEESPVQSPVAIETAEAAEAGGAGKAGGSRQAAPQPDLHPPTPHIEAISSGTEPRGTLSLGGGGSDGDEGVDGIVPSMPTIYEPKRNDGFGEAIVSPVGGSGSAGAGSSGVRCTFAVAGAGAPTTPAVHHDTRPDPATAMFPTQPDNTEGESRDWEESGAEEDSSAVSSRDSEPSSPRQMSEEGHELESPVPRRYSQATPHSLPIPNQRWIRGADSESSARGRGERPRGRPPMHSRNNMRL